MVVKPIQDVDDELPENPERPTQPNKMLKVSCTPNLIIDMISCSNPFKELVLQRLKRCTAGQINCFEDMKDDMAMV